MNNIKLIADSSSDLPEDVIKEYDLGLVRLNVAFGDEDVSNISNDEFYAKMRTYPILPKTSAPSPEKFLEQFQLAGIDKDIIVVSLAEKLSSTIGSAKLAKELYAEESNKKVMVLESGQGSIGLGILVMKIAQMIEEGVSFDDIGKKYEEIRNNIVHYGVLDTLENAIKGGRVNKAQGIIANALNIKAIIEIVDGVVSPIDKSRGSKNGIKKALDIFVNKIEEKKKDHHYTILGIAHANSPEKANLVLDELKGRLSFDRVVVAEIGSLMGTYTAEGAVLISAI